MSRRFVSPRSSELNNGFTLIEVMIVVAIVAILAAIAYPSYSNFVERGRRNDAKAVLLEAAQYMERVFTEKRSYASVTLPAAFTKSPREGTASYNISVSSDASSYTLTATPVITPKFCGNLTLDQLGSKGRSVTTDTLDFCWNR